jgi:two-component system C4-dicarboxylate transport sensor histidine kinase DctB
MVAQTALQPVARTPRAGALIAMALTLAAMLVAAAVAGRIARERAATEVADRAAAALPLATAALIGVIETQRLIPLVLARDPEVIALLAAPAPAPEKRLDAKLADIAADAGSAVIYLVDRDGLAIAASNAGQPDSFVGSNYAFRTYFAGAMAEGSAAQYALGTVSGRPGLYLTRRVDGVQGPLGIVVVKVEFDALEARWRDSGFVVNVSDPFGVVLTTSEPDWRFGTLAPLADEASVRQALQLDDRPMPPVPIAPGPDGLVLIDRGSTPQVYAAAAGSVGPQAPGWRISLFAPAGAALDSAARTAQALTMLALLLLASTAAALVRRRRSAQARQAALAEVNEELERRVAERTEALNRSNSRLAAEIAERESAETRARRLRDDLAQANRLSILGQVAAGVAHEINQPVAAIRTYAESGSQLLAAGQPQATRENLAEIVSVTVRIGAITEMLKGFARRGKGEVRAVPPDAAIDGALALLAGRIREADVEIVREPAASGAAVEAGRIRLEQILVNLLQNALDAMRGQEERRILIAVAPGPERVAVRVRDSGPGLDPTAREQLFMPFNTTKEKGLGLGLVISADIAREFGGDLRLDPDGPGACFVLELRRAA